MKTYSELIQTLSLVEKDALTKVGSTEESYPWELIKPILPDFNYPTDQLLWEQILPAIDKLLPYSGENWETEREELKEFIKARKSFLEAAINEALAMV